MYENEMKSGYPVNYDPDYAYDDENMPIPEQEPDEQALAFQKEIEEREAFMQEHMTLPDGTTDLTTFGWTSLRRLMCKELPSIRYIVDGLLPQGLAILASPPKYGKSWLALDLCISVALGEPFFGLKTEPCDTLYWHWRIPSSVCSRADRPFSAIACRPRTATSARWRGRSLTVCRTKSKPFCTGGLTSA